MSNTKNGLASKGSKCWMQKVVNPTAKDFFKDPRLLRYHKYLANKLTNDENGLVWISPLSKENYHEYKLNETKLQNIRRDILGLDDENFNKHFKFWPSQGHPVWDAIALSKDGTNLFLFEAKAHINEMETKCNAKPGENRTIIEKSMSEAYKHFSVKNNNPDDIIKDVWMQKYYQLGNRLTFLFYMNKIISPKIRHTTLVLLNIINDEYGKTDRKAWNKHYIDFFKKMIGSEIPPKDVKILFIPDNESDDEVMTI